jgi:predicted phage tail protein
MQQVVRLLGDLGERYGAEHVYHNLRTPADAIKLLCINYPAFQVELITAHEKGIGYRVLQAGVDLNINDLHLPIGQNDLIVTPVLAGADGVGQFFAGAALIAAAVILAPVSGGASVGFLGATGTGFLTASASVAIGSIGASLVLGGVTQMLSPQPSFGGVGGVSPRGEFRATRPESVNRGFDGQQSYAYLGAQNTVGVGATIPVAYGRVLIGSHVISADVDVADESDPLKKVTRAPGPDTVTVNGNKLEFGTRREGMARWNNVNFQKNYSSPSNDRILTIEKGDTHQMANTYRLEFTEGPTKSPDFYYVCIEILNLFKFSSGPGSTKTDGFISYQIEAKNVETGSITARESFTIQGLVIGTYRYYHKFNPNKISFKDFYKTRVHILDASIDSGSRMTFFHGFNPSFS